MTLPIKGLQKTCLINYPPYASCVVFLAGCNLRCGYCHNPDLIVEVNKTPTMPEEEFFSFLKKRKMWLDAVVISGGEPCIYEELPDFISKIKELGYKVKLDTNGTNPDMIKDLIKNKMIDYIAMDIKGSLEGYDKAANIKVDKEKIKESVKIIIESSTPYEFRTTCVPGLIDKNDFDELGNWLKGSKKFFIQDFRNQICLDTSFQEIKPFSKEELNNFKDILNKYIDCVEVR